MDKEHNETTSQETPPHVQPEITPKPSHKDGGFGPVIAIIIIIVILALGAMYYFTTGIEQIQNNQPTEESTGINGDAEANLQTQGSATDLDAIEADLDNTDFSGLDEASADFEAELNQ
ncbi:MAG: hypothetical protein ACJKTH_01120 [Patescibacteria group bacterium UBA2163]